MKISNTKKMWSEPTITSIDRLKNAANNTGTGLPKGTDSAEFLYDGPGS